VFLLRGENQNHTIQKKSGEGKKPFSLDKPSFVVGKEIDKFLEKIV